jgi:ADP-ribose pyrophosphatase YjhB (NUDIX family)
MPLPARQRPFVGAYCLVRRGDEILFMQRQNTRYADGQWSIPGGHVDEGESATQTVSRELFEETGLIVSVADWRMACVMHRKTADRECIDLVFIADRFSGELENREPDKCAHLAFRPLGKLPTPFLGYIDTAIKAIDRQNWSGIVYLEDGWNLVNE